MTSRNRVFSRAWSPFRFAVFFASRSRQKQTGLLAFFTFAGIIASNSEKGKDLSGSYSVSR
jgi:hypothetical protein